MMSTRILIVGCGFPQLGLLRFCRAEGLTVVGLDLNPEAVGRPFCHEFVVASTTDADAIVLAAQAHQVDGLTTCGSDHAVIPTAVAAELLGMPFYVESSRVQACIHKDDMRDLYAKGGAPSPAHRNVKSLTEAKDFASRQGLPLVVKPARGWGQRGVRVVMNEPELAQGVQDALDAAKNVMTEPRCVIEQFVGGREFSVDAYTLNGKTEVLAITERIITSYPNPPGITFAEVFPPQVPEEERFNIEQAAIRGLAALGIQRGPSYTQVRSGAQGAFIVETALRLGGGLDPDVTYLASGVSLYRKIVGVALNRPQWESAGPEGPAHGGATGRFIVGKPGRVVEIRGLEEARSLPGVVSAEVYVRPGGTVFPLTDGSKRAGHVLAYGCSRDEAEERARRAMDTIHILTEGN